MSASAVEQTIAYRVVVHYLSGTDRYASECRLIHASCAQDAGVVGLWFSSRSVYNDPAIPDRGRVLEIVAEQDGEGIRSARARMP